VCIYIYINWCANANHAARGESRHEKKEKKKKEERKNKAPSAHR